MNQKGSVQLVMNGLNIPKYYYDCNRMLMAKTEKYSRKKNRIDDRNFKKKIRNPQVTNPHFAVISLTILINPSDNSYQFISEYSG